MFKVKIYKVVCDCGCGQIYVGSTKQPLYKRFYQHKTETNLGGRSRFYLHMRTVGIDKFKIVLIKEYQVKNHEERRMYEQKHIDELKPTLNSRNEISRPETWANYKEKILCKFCHMSITKANYANHERTWKHRNNKFKIEQPDKYKARQLEGEAWIRRRMIEEDGFINVYFTAYVLNNIKYGMVAPLKSIA